MSDSYIIMTKYANMQINKEN